MRKGLLAETVIIGASSTAAGQALKMAGLTAGKPAFWFGIGALTHLAWEATGGNRWYLENRDPANFPAGFLPYGLAELNPSLPTKSVTGTTTSRTSASGSGTTVTKPTAKATFTPRPLAAKVPAAATSAGLKLPPSTAFMPAGYSTDFALEEDDEGIPVWVIGLGVAGAALAAYALTRST